MDTSQMNVSSNPSLTPDTLNTQGTESSSSELLAKELLMNFVQQQEVQKNSAVTSSVNFDVNATTAVINITCNTATLMPGITSVCNSVLPQSKLLDLVTVASKDHEIVKEPSILTIHNLSTSNEGTSSAQVEPNLVTSQNVTTPGGTTNVFNANDGTSHVREHQIGFVNTTSGATSTGLPHDGTLPASREIINMPDALEKSETEELVDPSSPEVDVKLYSQFPTAPASCGIEHMQSFVNFFKQRRIALGFTQEEVGIALGTWYGSMYSQTTICRFEGLQLSSKKTNVLKRLLEQWLVDATQKVTDGGIRKRKKRVTFDATMKEVLERHFMLKKKPKSEDIAQIAAEVNLDRKVVRIWFCNRRQKDRKLAGI
ncbi:POU domain, class 3, transcription factor 4-like [Xenia sp. Carnegie-2017]|uniref:POU domain, class 3, transcription factor 4-like n=1 Tax=Xenia sp. Carnegie-2017 TaxID=2897299 RepID=UPI001F03A663|nr:POU domain, class 3, transcription factor 4-like [Xenia sp. Carnegie-2017]XP_046848407.1 POU domain, class 3, transcription factor 4-like [Xenia sp. Carnegie-2017]